MSILKFYSSNQSKLDEYQKYGLPAELHTGEDLREVASDPLTVVLYKALEIPDNCLVEDTSFEVEGSDIGVDIKFRINELEQMVGRNAKAIVLLAHKKDGYIYVYESVVEGTITSALKTTEQVFGFDGVFTPKGSEVCLHIIKNSTRLHHMMPRWIVTQNFINGIYIAKKEVTSIPAWTGNYQT